MPGFAEKQALQKYAYFSAECQTRRVPLNTMSGSGVAKALAQGGVALPPSLGNMERLAHRSSTAKIR